MIVRLDVKSNHPTISDIDDSGIRPRPKNYSGSFAGQEPQKWLAGLVAAMLAPLRLEHRPFDFVGLATEPLDRVANLFISQVRFLNLDRCHLSCSLALFIRRTVREPCFCFGLGVALYSSGFSLTSKKKGDTRRYQRSSRET